MAFGRSFLKSMSLTDEQVSAIMEEHISVTDALKAQRDKFENQWKEAKAEADKVPGLENQIKDLNSGEDWKKKFEDEHASFENFKKELTEKEKVEKVKEAYKKLLSEEKISEKRHDAIMRVTDFSNMKLDKDGKLENLDSLKEAIGKEWSEFKVIERQQKQNVPTPPGGNNNGGGEGRARELYLKHVQQRGIKIENDAGKE